MRPWAKIMLMVCRIRSEEKEITHSLLGLLGNANHEEISLRGQLVTAFDIDELSSHIVQRESRY